MRPTLAQSLAGLWQQNWQIRGSTNFPNNNPSDASVNVFGYRWVANFMVADEEYVLEGQIKGNLITGRWHGATEASYHGVAQLLLSPSLISAKGIWSGFRSNGEIGAGEWVWKKIK
jgi:hypothetical protein